MFSTIKLISSGGFDVKKDTTRAITKLRSIPTKPIPSGEIPKSQFDELSK
jgi:hypothetical protein